MNMHEPTERNPMAQALWTLLVHVRRLEAMSQDDPGYGAQKLCVSASAGLVVGARHSDPLTQAQRERDAVDALWPALDALWPGIDSDTP